jgi:hypothetical protein
MQVVETKEELMENIATIDKYLEDASYMDYTKGLIQRGTCFVLINRGGDSKFYPSRFVGYKNNTYSKHESSQDKDGRVTNVAITKILNDDPMANDRYELEYRKYCQKLGIVSRNKGSFGVQRKYWIIS